MFSLGSAQAVVFFALGVVAFLVQLGALLDGARRRPEAYVAAGKQTKKRWIIILAVAAAIGFISFHGGFPGPLNFLNVAAVVAAGVYLADVRPALQRVQGSGRGGTSGPYGPW